LDIFSRFHPPSLAFPSQYRIFHFLYFLDKSKAVNQDISKLYEYNVYNICV